MNQMSTRVLPVAVALLLAAGCATSPETKPEAPERAAAAPDVQSAEKLFQSKRYTEAIVACIEISRQDPLTPGLADLQAKIMNRVAQLRQEAIKAQMAASSAASAADAARHGILPDTYRLTRHVVGENSPLITPDNKMQESLRKPVSVHLEGVGLTEIIAQIGTSQNINFVADTGVGSGKTITIHAEKTPLEEILEYIGRNMGVTFSVGQNMIWVTPGNDKLGAIPLETRIYRLRKGLPANEIPGGAALGEKAQPGTGEISIVASIKKFIPQPAGAEIVFDTRAHALLVKNTRENLAQTEKIINALDVRQPQVLIEARFIETKAGDLRQLGIDWLMGAPAPPLSAAAPNTMPLPGGATTNLLSGQHVGYGELVGGAGVFKYQGVLDNLRMQAILSAMQSSEQNRTLTVPRITTVNNRTATIHIGEEFQYYDNITTTASNQNTIVNNTVVNNNNNAPTFSGTPKTLSLGFNLAVTPSIGADLATINLALIPDITELQNKSKWEAFNDPMNTSVSINNMVGKLPIVLQKKVETEMVVRSGETVVMGGLAQASGGKSRSGIPWLSELPFIGQLFRKDSVNEGTDNLLIFVTATVISDVGEELIPLRVAEVAASDALLR
jgi:type II secretory pathway component GspD/PulD (secretin)